MSRARSVHEIAAEIAAALMKGQHTASKLCEHLGVDMRHSAQVRRYVTQFRQSGCVRVCGLAANNAEVYEWQTALFALPDSVAPWTAA